MTIEKHTKGLPFPAVTVVNIKTGNPVGSLIGLERDFESGRISRLTVAAADAPQTRICLPWICIERITAAFILVYY